MVLTIERRSAEMPPAALVDLVNRCYVDSPRFSPVAVNGFEELRAQPRFRPELLLIAYLNGRPVGLCLALLKQGEPRAWLEWIGVLPEYRRRGVAKALLERCLDSLRSAGAKELLVGSVELDDRGARGFLESQGFREGFHQLRMVRDLTEPLPEVPLPGYYGIRVLQPGEEEAWLRVRNEAFCDEAVASQPWGIEDFQREFVQSPYAGKGRVFVAKHEGEVVGITAAWVLRFQDVETEVVHWVAVLPRHRRRRLGQALVIEAMRFFKARGSKKVWLITFSALTNAVRLYKKLGFTVEHETTAYAKPIA